MTTAQAEVRTFLQRFYENYTRETLARLIIHRLAGSGPRSQQLELLEPILSDGQRNRLIAWLITELEPRLSYPDAWTAFVTARCEELQVLWGMSEDRALTSAIRQAVVLGLRPAYTTYKDSLLPDGV